MRLLLHRFPAVGGLLLFALLCAAMVDVATANAATLIVTNTNDSGPGSLRQALADAHNGDTIQFDPALNGQTISLTSGELAIQANITIDGPGPDLLTISRSSGTFRIFHLTNGFAVIRGLTVSGGFAADLGGGIRTDAGTTLNIVNCSIQDNVALVGGLGASGGGIYNVGGMTIMQSTISDNATLAGGGVANTGNMEISNSAITGNHAYQITARGGNGGGIVNTGTLTINESVVSGNLAGEHNPLPTAIPSVTPYPLGVGGGILHTGTALTIYHSIISGNTATGDAGVGGGIFTGYTPLNITASTINNNQADNQGGGIYGGGPITITDSTISGNHAGSAPPTGFPIAGGGIRSDGTLSIRNSTISGNTADQNGSGGGIYAGAIPNSTVTITNSTISANQGGGIVAGPPVEIANTILKAGAFGANISGGTVTSHGYNLSSDDGGGFLTGPGDQINTEPLLGPLQDNGGSTFTHALLPGSPAIDAGDPNFVPPPDFDQRGPGYPRVSNGRIDIGSFEVQPAPTPSPTPTATATATATSPPTVTATPTPTSTATPTPTPSTIQLANISTRLRVETGDNVGISGFIIHGAGSLQTALRGIGPSLGQLGLPDYLPDPILELRDSSGALIAQNDNWQDDPAQAAQLTNLGLAPGHPAESGLIVALQPGAYTAIVAGKNGGTGVGLVEVYNVDRSVPAANIELANISTRGFVQTGANVMIGGFILGGGNNNSGIVLRGIGPTLAQSGLSNVLADPTLELRDSHGMLLIANDNWQDDPVSAAQLTAHGLAPQNPLESGIFASLPPGAFTAILAGKNGGSGIGLVEIYNVH